VTEITGIQFPSKNSFSRKDSGHIKSSYRGSRKDEVYIDPCVVRVTTLITYFDLSRTAINLCCVSIQANYGKILVLPIETLKALIFVLIENETGHYLIKVCKPPLHLLNCRRDRDTIGEPVENGDFHQGFSRLPV
jgi:hypothetical protein